MHSRPKPYNGKVLPRDLENWRLICFLGDDDGLITARAKDIVKKIVGDAQDPFRVVVLDKADYDKLEGEYCAISMMGGRRVIRVRDVGDDIRKAVAHALEHESDNLIVLQAQNIVAPSRSSLCRFLSKQPGCAIVKCYKENRQSLQGNIKRELAQHGVKIENDALQYFLNHVDNGNAIIDSELEKLRFYIYPHDRITLEDVQQSVGDSGEARLDAIAYETLSGQVSRAVTSLGRAYEAGQNSIAIIRTTLNYMERLRRLFIRKDKGEAPQVFLRNIHFMRRQLVAQTLQKWTLTDLNQEISHIQELEYACKQTAAPAEILCRQHFLILAKRASMR